MSVNTPDSIRQLRQVREVTGKTVQLRPYESVKLISITDTSVTLIVQTYEVKDLVRETRITKSGIRLIEFVCDDSGAWVYAGASTVWDEAFVPEVHVKSGHRLSPDQHLERMRWERDCYRPGTDISPMDSCRRTLDGPSPMERYW